MEVVRGKRGSPCTAPKAATVLVKQVFSQLQSVTMVVDALAILKVKAGSDTNKSLQGLLSSAFEIQRG